MFSSIFASGKLSLFFTAVLSTCSFANFVNCENGTQPDCGLKTKYPNKCQIAQIFDNLSNGNFDGFFEHVADDVHWTLMGTHPLAGSYHNRTIFIADSLMRLNSTFDPSHPSTLVLEQPVIGGGDEEWSVQQLHGLGLCKNGLVYDNMFAWITRWNTNGTIVEVNAFLDSALVQQAITQNESPVFNYTSSRNQLMPGPMGSNCKE